MTIISFFITFLIFIGTIVGIRSYVGDTPVPSGLFCQEDEVISWTDQDKLGCVHFEEID